MANEPVHASDPDILWVDVADVTRGPGLQYVSYTLDELRALQDAGYSGVCARIYAGARVDYIAGPTIRNALSLGMHVGGYIYLTRVYASAINGVEQPPVTLFGERSVNECLNLVPVSLTAHVDGETKTIGGIGRELWDALSFVAVDIENIKGFNFPLWRDHHWRDAQPSDIRTCVTKIAAEGQKPIIYTYADFWWNTVHLGNPQGFNNFDFWLAWTLDSKNERPNPSPITSWRSPPWPDPKFYNGNVGGWQRPAARQWAHAITISGVRHRLNANISPLSFFNRGRPKKPNFVAYSGWARRLGHTYDTVRLGLKKYITTAKPSTPFETVQPTREGEWMAIDAHLAAFSSAAVNTLQEPVYGDAPEVNPEPFTRHNKPVYAERNTEPFRRQMVIIGATGGTFTLELGNTGVKTASLSHTVTATQLELALEALDSVTSVEVTGAGTYRSPFHVLFVEDTLPSYLPLTPDDAALTGNVYVYADRYELLPPEAVPTAGRVPRLAGDRGVRLFIDNLERTKNLKDRTLRCIDGINPLGDTMTFVLTDRYREGKVVIEDEFPDEFDALSADERRSLTTFTVKPKHGALVTLWYNGVKEFEGPVVQIREYFDSPTTLVYEVSCRGYWTWLESEIVTYKEYPRQSATDTIYDIVSEFAPDFSLRGVEGIHPYNGMPEPEPLDGSQAHYKLPQVAEKTLQYITPAQVISQLAKEADFQWHIDFDRTIHTFRRSTEEKLRGLPSNLGVAPIETVFPDNVERRAGGGREFNTRNYIIETNYWDFQITEDSSQLANVIVLRDYDIPTEKQTPVTLTKEGLDAVFQLPYRVASTQDEDFVVEIRKPTTTEAQNANPGLQSGDVSGYISRIESRLTATGWDRAVVTSDAGVVSPAQGARRVYVFEDEQVSTPDDVRASRQIILDENKPYSTGDKAILVSKEGRTARTPPGGDEIPAGAVVIFHHKPVSTESSDFTDAAAVTAQGILETVPWYPDRSGRHVRVESRSGRIYNSREDVNADARGILAIRSKPLITGSFKTSITGWRPGQYFKLQSRRRGYRGLYVIVTNVSKTLTKTDVSADSPGAILESTVSFSNTGTIG